MDTAASISDRSACCDLGDGISTGDEGQRAEICVQPNEALKAVPR